tara:strand:- start:61 stop:789 length:729 start_codon:yes stop_codon:yes gene_type:complete
MACHGGPDIVEDNLVFCLDAGNTKSYDDSESGFPGGGGTWNDISGKGHTATINGATFNSGNGGCFIFDGTNDYAKIDDSSDFLMGTGSFTEEAWHKRDGNTTWEAPFARYISTSWGGLWINNSGNFYPYHYTEPGGFISFPTGDAVGTDWVHHVTTTTNTGSAVTIKVYKNSVLQDTQSTTVSGWQPKGTSVGDSDIYIGGMFGTTYWYDGKIAICRLYKGKALSAAEVKQNFNANRGRFNL